MTRRGVVWGSSEEGGEARAGVLDVRVDFAIFGFLLVVGYVANRVLGLLRRRYLFWLASERPNAGM